MNGLKELLCETLGGLTWIALWSEEKEVYFLVAGSLDIYSMPEGKSHVAPTGEAPTYVNTQRIPQQTGPATGSSAESSPRKDLFDMSVFPFAIVFFFFKAVCFFFLNFVFCLKSVQLLNFLPV